MSDAVVMDCESQLPPPARNNTRTIVGGLVAATLAVALVVALRRDQLLAERNHVSHAT